MLTKQTKPVYRIKKGTIGKNILGRHYFLNPCGSHNYIPKFTDIYCIDPWSNEVPNFIGIGALDA